MNHIHKIYLLYQLNTLDKLLKVKI